MSKVIQNFYKSQLTQDWSIGTGNFYVEVKPTITDGWLVISPNNSGIREIIRYTSTGTDGNGDYVVVSQRGVGGTTEQIHTQGEPIRMNITAEYWAEMTDDINNIVASGVPNANTTTMGGVEIATDDEVIAGTDTGGTGATLVAKPSQINTRINTRALPADIQTFNASGTWTKPTGAKSVHIITIGGGASGGGGSTGGGGGGALNFGTIPADLLGATVTVTVGAGGAARPYGSGGLAGGTSSFGTWISAGGGEGSTAPNGGHAGAGVAATTKALSRQGGFYDSTATGVAEYGGGAGGASSQNNRPGGSSIFAAGGGGGGGANNSGGWAGGTSGSYSIGGGGAGGASGTNNPGTAGASGATLGKLCGAGGGGGGTKSSDSTAGAGGDGGFPGGGGGAGGLYTGGTGGAGGGGQVIVTTYF